MTSASFKPDTSENYLKPGNLILCSYTGCPWWPSFIYNDYAMPPALLDVDPKDRSVPVVFMGTTRSLSWIASAHTKPYDPAFQNQWRSKKGSMSKAVKKDYAKAWEECENESFGDYIHIVTSKIVESEDDEEGGDESSASSGETRVKAKKSAPRSRKSSIDSSRPAKKKKPEPVLDESDKETKRILDQRTKYDAKRKERSKLATNDAKKPLKASDLKYEGTSAEKLQFLRFRFQNFLQAPSHSDEDYARMNEFLSKAESFPEKMTAEYLRSTKIGKVAKRIAVMDLRESTFNITMRCLELCRKWAREAFPEKFEDEGES